MKAVILAAGKGKRLKPLTDRYSKALAPVAGKPMIVHVLDKLLVAGISSFVIVKAQGDNALESVLRASFTDKMLEFVVQAEQRGMADALLQAEKLVGEAFLVSACDSFCEADFFARLIARHASEGAVATIGAQQVPESESLGSKSVILVEGHRVRSIIEKPDASQRLSNISGLPHYVFKPQIFADLKELKPSPRGEYEVQDALQTYCRAGLIVAAEFATQRSQITTIDDFLQLNIETLEQKVKTKAATVTSAENTQGTSINEPCIIEPGAIIGSRCRIGPRVYIQSGACVGDDVCISEAVVLSGGKVPAGSQVKQQVVF